MQLQFTRAVGSGLVIGDAAGLVVEREGDSVVLACLPRKKSLRHKVKGGERIPIGNDQPVIMVVMGVGQDSVALGCESVPPGVDILRDEIRPDRFQALKRTRASA